MKTLKLIGILIMLLLPTSIIAQENDISITALSDETNQFSNDRIATSLNEMIFPEQYKKISGTETVNKDLLIVLKTNGNIASYDYSTLKEVWNFKFTDGSTCKMDNQFRIEGAVLYAASTQRQLVALNVNDGEICWITNIGNQTSELRYEIAGQRLPIKDNLIYLASCNKQLYAFDKNTGSHVWNYKLDYEFNLYSPVIYKNHLIIPNAPYIYYFDATTGQAIWQRGFGSEPMYVQPQIDNEKAYVAGERHTVYALNLENTANIDWQFATQKDQGIMDESPILDNGIYYFATNKGDDTAASVYALETMGGQLKWKTTLNSGDKIKAFTLLNDYLAGFTSDESDNFFLLERETGNKYLTTTLKEPAISNIIQSDKETILFLTKNHLVKYHIKENTFEYKEFELNDNGDDDSFFTYIELVKPQ